MSVQFKSDELNNKKAEDKNKENINTVEVPGSSADEAMINAENNDKIYVRLNI